MKAEIAESPTSEGNFFYYFNLTRVETLSHSGLLSAFGSLFFNTYDSDPWPSLFFVHF